jgi:hypothetical protein
MEELCRTRNIILYGDCFYVLLFGIIHTLNGSVVTLSIHVVGEMQFSKKFSAKVVSATVW